MAKNCCFKGRGHVLLVDYAKYLAKTAGFVRTGNAPVLSVNVVETVERVPDYTSAAGGTDCISRLIERAEVSLSLRCHSLDNLALALYGDGAEGNVPAAAVASEPHVAWPGAVVPLDGLVDAAQPITVLPPDGETPYVAGADYSVTEAGSILIIAGGSIPVPTIADGEGVPNIHVSYQRAEHSRLQLFNRPSKPVALHFDGVNAMGGGGATHFDLYKVQFGPATAFQAISDNAGLLEFTGEVLRDEGKPAGTLAAPFSQYGTLRV